MNKPKVKSLQKHKHIPYVTMNVATLKGFLFIFHIKTPYFLYTKFQNLKKMFFNYI